jgi:hypothetical protein
VLRSGQQVVEEGLSVLSNYLLDQLRELTSQHTLQRTKLIYLAKGMNLATAPGIFISTEFIRGTFPYDGL